MLEHTNITDTPATMNLAGTHINTCKYNTHRSDNGV